MDRITPVWPIVLDDDRFGSVAFRCSTVIELPMESADFQAEWPFLQLSMIACGFCTKLTVPVEDLDVAVGLMIWARSRAMPCLSDPEVQLLIL